MIGLDMYSEIVGKECIAEIYKRTRNLHDQHILHVNSTYQGGGVAEMLNSLLPLFHDIGIDAGWRILHGNPDFFTITKKFHNALQGERIHFTERKKQLYIQASESFSTFVHINHDCVIVHDPQPLPLVKFYRKRQPWIWRCHVDLSHPNEDVWEFLSGFLLRYDLILVSHEDYMKKDLPVEQKVIRPAIDPLSLKNVDISDRDVSRVLKKFGVKTDKPLIVQISRYDKWKDPEGVIQVFKLVKKEVDCRLILCGNMATDDPEGGKIYDKTRKEATNFIDSGDVVLLTDPAGSNSVFINALQRKASVMIQKSIREGFGLTVTEAMWKETPVVASNIGGIPLQITDGEDGFLLDSSDIHGFAARIVELLQDQDLAERVGKKAKEKVRKNFLITRLVMDYLDILNDTLKNR